jgi:hypothetical protein
MRVKHPRHVKSRQACEPLCVKRTVHPFSKLPPPIADLRLRLRFGGSRCACR